MSRTIYALFVGIDRYAGKVSPLNSGGRGKHDLAAGRGSDVTRQSTDHELEPANSHHKDTKALIFEEITMNINISREAVIDNPLKNNLRPLPHLDSEPFVQIAHKTTVLVLDGPITFRHKTLDIPYWVVRVLEGDYRDRVGWMAEINQSGKDILQGI